jgi:hypothetical protein
MNYTLINGDVETVLSINQEEHDVTITIDDKKIVFNKQQLSELSILFLLLSDNKYTDYSSAFELIIGFFEEKGIKDFAKVLKKINKEFKNYI